MKYFVYAFSGFLITLCIAFLVINFATGNVNPNSHFHLDVLVYTANQKFNEVFKNDYLFKVWGNLTAPGLFEIVIEKVEPLVNFAKFLWTGISSIIGLFRAVISIFTTPCIY